MSRQAVAWLLVALGGCLFAAGLLLGFSSINRLGTNCGSALGGYNQSSAEQADFTRAYEGFGAGTPVEDACSAAISDRTPIAWALVIPGGGLLLASLVVRPSGRPRIDAGPQA